MNCYLRLGLLINMAFILVLRGAYQWPLPPFNEQHNISATFCENRPSSDGSVLIDHFHNAIDIPLAEGGDVYAIEAGSVESIVREGYSAWIRVGNFNYLHVTPLATLDVGDNVQKGQLVGHTNYANHIHLIDGHYPDYINPLRPDGIAPFNDPYQPTVAYIKFYQDGSTREFSHGKVSGKVDIVARLYDRTDNGAYGSNNGIYLAGYQIFDSSGTVPLSDVYTPYRFDVRPGNSYVKNVYFPGSDLSTYIYILSNRITGNNYWNTAVWPPAKYLIRVYTEDTRHNRRQFERTVEVVLPDHSPPAKPQIDLFALDENGDWQLAWQPDTTADVRGYEFYFSLNGETFSEQKGISAAIKAGDSLYSAQNYGTDYPLYVRLRAYDNAATPNFSHFSNTYVFKRREGYPEVLIVDGFARGDGYWRSARHDFAVDYARLLLQNDLSFNSCSLAGLRSGKVRLTDYAHVLLFNGDDSTLTDEGILEQIRGYLQNGGHLFISGSTYLSALVRQDQSLFLNDFLKVHGINATLQEQGLAFAGEILPLQTPYAIAPGTISVEPSFNGGIFWRYASGGIASVAYKGSFAGGQKEGAVVTCGFPFEMLQQDSLRDEMFKQALAFLQALPTGFAAHPHLIPQNKDLLFAYPNPFNGRVRLKYIMPGTDRIKIEIFNVGGKKVCTVLNKRSTAGAHEVAWDGVDSENRKVSSGIYIARMHLRQQMYAIKIILLR